MDSGYILTDDELKELNRRRRQAWAAGKDLGKAEGGYFNELWQTKLPEIQKKQTEQSFLDKAILGTGGVAEAVGGAVADVGKSVARSGRRLTGRVDIPGPAGKLLNLGDDALRLVSKTVLPGLSGDLEKVAPATQAEALVMLKKGKSEDEVRQFLQSRSQETSFKQTAGDILNVGSLVPGVGTVGGAVKVGQAARAGKALEIARRSTAPGAVYGATGTAGYELAENPNISAGELAKRTKLGAIGGATLGTAGGVIGSQAAKFRINRAVKNVRSFIDDENLPISEEGRKRIQAAIDVEKKYDQKAFGRVMNAVKRELYDPVNTFQKSDNIVANLDYKQYKRGERWARLIGDGRSLAEMAVNARFYHQFLSKIGQTKYAVGQGQNKVERSFFDVVKDYGIDTQDERLFKDYLNNKHILEIAEKYGKKKVKFDVDGLKKDVELYEASNPRAITDGKVMKNFYDEILDYTAKSGVEDPKNVEFVKKFFPNYHPLIPAKPEDLERIRVTGGLAFNVGKGVLKKTNELADVPLSSSFAKDFEMLNTYIGKSLKNQFDKEVLRRVKADHLPGFTLKIDADVSRAARGVREAHQKLVSEREAIHASLGQKVGQLRVENAYSAPTRREAAKTMRNYLIKTLEDRDARAAAASLTDKQAIEVMQAITGDKAVQEVRTELIKKGGKAQSLLDDLQRLKEDYGEVTVAAQNAYNQAGELAQGKATNLNAVTGLDKGEVFKIEVTPEWATALSYLSPKHQRGFYDKLAKGTADFQKILYTGPGAPIFQAIQPIKNIPVMFVNGRDLSPFGARAIAQAIRPGGDFKQKLLERGFRPETFTKTPSNAAETAAHIAAQGNVFSRVKHGVRHPGEFVRFFNQLGGFFGNRQRLQVARGSYQWAKNKGFNEEQALNLAARDANEILGNFNRVSDLAKAMEPFVLYTGATQAGIRPLYHALKERPVQTSVKLTGATVAMGGFAAASLSSEKGQEYFNDMVKSGRYNALANYVTYVFPWAEKNDKGEWKGEKPVTIGGKTIKIPGIMKMPLSPDYRALNKAVIEQVLNVTNDKDVDPVLAAQELFNFLTGGVIASQQGTGISPKETAKQNILFKGANIYAGKDPQSGFPINEQVTPNTSEIGKRASELLGGKISANQIDAVLRQGGLLGSSIASGEVNPIEGFKKHFRGGKSQSPQSEAYEAKQTELQQADPVTRKLYEARHAVQRDEETGEIEFEDNPFNTVKNSAELLSDIATNDGKLFDLERRMAQIDAEKTGKPVQPIYEMSPEQAKTIMLADVGKVENLYEYPWYEKYQEKYDKYIEAKKAYSKKQGYEYKEPIDPYPKAKGALDKKLKQYNKLPSNDGPRGGNKTRSLYIKANPEVGDFFDNVRRWKNRRLAYIAEITGVELPLKVDEFQGRPLY